MNPKLAYRLTGYLSIAVGIGASIGIYRPHFMMYSIALSLLGFILSGINVYLNQKYFAEQDRFPKGLLGMFLSSLPVLFLLFMIFRSRH